MKILYVEDNTLDADLAQRVLAGRIPHLALQVATSLAEARACLAGGAGYDVAMIDLHLPDGSGLDLLQDIREQALPLAVVILTGVGDEETAVAALKGGADDYLAKRKDYLKRLPLVLESALNRFRAAAARRTRPLQVLYAEHSTADIDLTRRHLVRYAPHIHLTVVHSASEALQNLPLSRAEPCPFDVLLLDYRLPGLNALEVLQVLNLERALDIPVLLVTGQGDEEVAAQALRLGAADYLVKHTGYLFELPAALENAYHRAQLVREQAALRASEERFRLLAENAQDIIYRYRLKPAPGFEYISPAATAITGFTPDDHYADPDLSYKLVHPDDRPILDQLRQGERVEDALVLRWVRQDGTIIWTEQRNTPIFDDQGELVAIEGIARDITERKQLEQAEREQRLLVEALLDSITTVNRTLELDHVLERVLANVGQVIHHDGANIMLFDSADSTVRVVRYCDCYAENGLNQPPLEVRHPFDSRPHLSHMIATQQPLAIPDVHTYPGWVEDPHTGWLRSYAGAPICIDGQCLGLINLDSRQPGAFSSRDAHVLLAFASQVAIAIRNAQLYAQLEAHKEQLEQAVEARTAELRHTKERVETILNNSPDAILLLGPDGTIRTGNPAFLRKFGYKPDEMYGHQPTDLVAPESASALENAVRLVVEGRAAQRLEVVARRKDGSTFDASAALSPVQESGYLLGVVCSLLDISAIKDLERLKDTFLSTAAHELRTPLTSIRAFSELLLTRDFEEERRTRYLTMIKDQSQRLADIIDDLLDLSRLEARRGLAFQIDEINVGNLIKEAMQPFVETSPQHSFRLEGVEQVPAIRGDAFRLNQVITNLVSNAVKYSPDGGTITIRCQVIPGFLEVSVADEGIGLTLEQQNHIFRRFYRAHSADLDIGGTGLGLSICKLIVEGHGGQIRVVSEPGVGSTFSFTLPLPGDENSAAGRSDLPQPDDAA